MNIWHDVDEKCVGCELTCHWDTRCCWSTFRNLNTLYIPPPQVKLLLLHTSPTLFVILVVIFPNFCCFLFGLRLRNIPSRLSHLIADSITSSRLQTWMQPVPVCHGPMYVLCDLYLCPLLGELSAERTSRKMAPTLLICLFVLFFFLPEETWSLPSLVCWGHSVTWILCDYFPNSPDVCAISRLFKIGSDVVSWEEKRGGHSEHYPGITDSPPSWFPFRFTVALVCSEPRHVRVTDIPHLKGWKGLACRLCCKGWLQNPRMEYSVTCFYLFIYLFQKAYSKEAFNNRTNINIHINTLHEKHPTNEKS